ncbi:unnamed protein product [Acanthosepion pharaonis]|uniref:Uncharacterized protein n=1 Tax=Acanthosepion pharaonis TaxID=158019 RepID=A0A812CX87_ACAPH|nr:unnamed protein product [Sepia pharaonis]
MLFRFLQTHSKTANFSKTFTTSTFFHFPSCSSPHDILTSFLSAFIFLISFLPTSSDFIHLAFLSHKDYQRHAIFISLIFSRLPTIHPPISILSHSPLPPQFTTQPANLSPTMAFIFYSSSFSLTPPFINFPFSYPLSRLHTLLINLHFFSLPLSLLCPSFTKLSFLSLFLLSYLSFNLTSLSHRCAITSLCLFYKYFHVHLIFLFFLLSIPLLPSYCLSNSYIFLSIDYPLVLYYCPFNFFLFLLMSLFSFVIVFQLHLSFGHLSLSLCLSLPPSPSLPLPPSLSVMLRRID